MSKNRRNGRGRETPPPKAEKKKVEPFPLGIGVMMRLGFEGLRREPAAMLVGALLPVLGTMPLLVPAAMAFDDDRASAGVTFTMTALVLGGALAYPWCHYALRAAREEPLELAEPFREWIRFFPMLVASFWFWAGMLLAFQFRILGGLPAVAITMAYAFFGFVVDERHDQGGLKALGTSVRIGDGRRFALLALVCLYSVVGFVVFLLAASAAVGVGLTGAAASAVVAVMMTPFIAFTLVAWASLYDVLRRDLVDAW